MTTRTSNPILEVDGRQVEVVSDYERMRSILVEIIDSFEVHALDFETTTLFKILDDPRSVIRISAISGPVGNFIFDHGPDEEGPASFARLSFFYTHPEVRWAVFNAGFEQRWIDHYHYRKARLLDVGLMSKARLGGRPLSLAQMVKRDLSKSRDKELQRSDWSAPDLTAEQLAYAAEDALDTFDLFEFWRDELEEHGCLEGFYIFNDAVRGTTVMEDAGVLIDVPYHLGLIQMWQKRRDAAEAALRRITDAATLPNIRSKKQISDLIKSALDREALAAWPKTEKTGQLDTSRNVLRQMSFRAPYPFSRWLAALMVFNRADKYLGTYGEKLINIQQLSGRIKARFNIAQAITGRYSSSEPNLQNIPRSPLVRRSFIARPNGVLMLVDYSGIELRVLGELSNDKQLLQDVIYGDMHAENAAIQNGLDRERFFAALKNKDPKAKELRSRAKAFSFQLTYGAGIAALALALRSTDDAARRHVDAWAARYPNAYNYRTKVFELMNVDGFIRTAGGRTIYISRQDRSIPVASNYPIQGSAGDVMYRAIDRVEQLYYEQNAGSAAQRILLASIHDELLSEVVYDGKVIKKVMEEHATAQLGAKMHAMELAWLDVFPGSDTANLMEGAIGYSWAAKA